jgi:hypothetical protein
MPPMLVRLVFFALCAATFVAAAPAARLPGVRTPTGNIRCFVVPVRPTRHTNLLCTIRVASYTALLQRRCIAPPTGLDWHGFQLPDSGRARVVCSGGILYDGRDHPVLRTLAYGQVWRQGPYTCRSRLTGLTCTNGPAHGLIISRAEWRAW